jgi:hypothetical protein
MQTFLHVETDDGDLGSPGRSVANVDWPSRTGLSVAAQQAELRAAAGTCGVSAWSSQKYGADYRFANPAPVSDVAWFRTTVPAAGDYRVDVWHPADPG